MKKTLLIFCLAALFQSCSRKVPLSGKYQQGSVKSKINEPFDSVWNRAIDFIAESGVSIQLIDKASGLILGEVASFYKTITHEDKNGKVVDPTAFIVSEKFGSDTDREMWVYLGTAKWNMRIKETEKGTCVVSVNMHSILVKRATMPMNAESTGNLEKLIIDSLFK